MAARLYSTRFISTQGLDGSGADVVVPVGHVYVVKQLTFYTDPVFGSVFGRFKDQTTGATLFACGAPDLAPAWFGFYGTLTFLEGQSFHWEVSASISDAADVGAFGYDLLID